MNGRSEKLSTCCSAALESRGDICNGYWSVCSNCGKGSWPYGVNYYEKYLPSDYEKSLENRIKDLEKRVTSLEYR